MRQLLPDWSSVLLVVATACGYHALSGSSPIWSAAGFALAAALLLASRARLARGEREMAALDAARRDLERDVKEQGRGLRFVNAALELAAVNRREDKERLASYRRLLESLPPEHQAALDALHENEQLLSGMIAGVRDYAIYRLDSRGRVASWGEGARAITGWEQKEMIGRPYSDVLGGDDPAAARALLDEAAREGRAEREGWRPRKDGTRFWAHETAAALKGPDGELVGWVQVARDGTERRRIQQELERQAAALERSNAELAQFAFVASHDLREPLHKVTAFAERVREKAAGSLDAEGLDFLERMLRSVHGMERLVDAILDLARVTARARPPEVVDLGPLARDVVDGLEETLRSCGGWVEIGELPRVQADALQIRRLLQNLISNGLKFRRPGAKPRVAVAGRLLGDGRCEVSVTDDGVGFEMRFADRIFKPFQRLHGRAEYEGTGMGLAICRKIVDRHGGTIEVESEPGRGTRFVVRLPVSQDDRAAAGTPSAPAGTGGQLWNKG